MNFLKLIQTLALSLIFLFVFSITPNNNLKQNNIIRDTVPDYFNKNYLRYDDFIYKDNIKTLQIRKESWELSYPIIEFGSDEKIKIGFDDLDGDIKTYSYKIIHCNSDWKPSDINYSEYLIGFEENQVTDYKLSFNTLLKYTHYNLSIPNENVQLKLPGNYLVEIYENYSEDDLIATARFYCIEPIFNISAECKRPTDINRYDSGQQIDFSVFTNGKTINDPYKDINVVMMQNFRKDNAIKKLKPLFVRDGELSYNLTEGNIFDAGIEFHYFDMKSIRYQSERIKQITYENKIYNVEIVTDLPGTFSGYIFNQDINGKYLVKIDEGNDSESEADYVNVKFSLPYKIPFAHGNVYVLGNFSNWNFTRNNQMKYNFNSRSYELQTMLKQGYYNYCYAYFEDASNSADISLIEGSHYQTENDYIIIVYYKDSSMRYEMPTGYQIVNSIIKYNKN